MGSYELTTCSFIIKIWIEETKEEAGETLWRGHITHIPSGNRTYFEDLPKMVALMLPYLHMMGIHTGNTSSLPE